MLDKSALYEEISTGLLSVWENLTKKALTGDSDESPEAVIKKLSRDVAEVISTATDNYIKGGEVTVDSSVINVISSSPGSPSVVQVVQPAKIK